MGDEQGGGDAIQCPLCTKTFKCRKELFHHMSSAVHRRQSVRCPWCRKTNIFTRVYDLSRHCDSGHFREYSFMPDGFLSIPNCFYLAVYPKDYAIMTKVQKYDSPIAIEARRVLTNHLDNIKAEDEIRSEIREGWKAGLKIAEDLERKEKEIKQMNEAKATAAKKHKKRKNGKENETPAKKMKQKGTMEETKAVYEQMFKTDPIKLDIPKIQNNDTPPMSVTEFESTERNKKEAKVVLTRLDKNGVRRLMSARSQNGKVVKEELAGKPFKAEAESSKGEQMKVTAAKVEKEEVVGELNTSKTFITEQEEKVDEVSTGEAIMEEKENVTGEVVDEQANVKEEGEIENKVGTDNETRIKEQVKVVEEVIGIEEKAISERCDESEEKERLGINNPLEGELQLITESLAIKTIPCEIVDTNVVIKEKRKTSYKDYVKKVKLATPTKERISDLDGGEVIVNEKGDSDEMKKGEDEIWRKVKDINNNYKESEGNIVGNESGESDKLNGQVKVVVNTETVDGKEPEIEPVEEVNHVATARSILEKGAMPMCPPARQQWGPDTLEEIDLGNGQVVQWPPKGWLNMTPDRRLLTVEMMAMTLEAFVYGEVAPEMSRCYLLDKYKFLALPGALVH
ncbi:probable inactive protein kinase DDB_G0270444 [Mercenaria mercenaria]|uniref:probable inactive protein kinase DDB_G0270444 n=1 Tax=Mercenaria mercenaria TaxID=6596 RepID=UPI00234F3FF0|nr:probable inactive protein kinase DDB_G0270444 [Mercenaria mercenaria]